MTIVLVSSIRRKRRQGGEDVTSKEGHTDVVSATHFAISDPPSVASEECSTVAGTPIVNRCNAAGWSIYYQHLFPGRKGTNLESFHETLYTTYIIPYQFH
jgi:hypothetical protein